MEVATRIGFLAFALAAMLVPERTLCQEITIGAREDARPFVWRDGDTGEYLGFLWDICTKATQRAGYSFHAIPLRAEDKAEFLNHGTRNYDLLCDPTTITLYRMKNFVEKGELSHLSFSPIVFVANGAYASHSSAEARPGWGETSDSQQTPQRCADLLKQAEEEIVEKRADPWITMVPPTNKGRLRFEIWGYVKGSTIGAVLEHENSLKQADSVGDRPLVCLKDFASHEDAADWFCTDRLARYFGDADIIKATIKSRSERPGGSCTSGVNFSADGTYEPYAYVTSSRNVLEFPKKFEYALYEMFTDGTVERLFTGHFSSGKSEYLRTLFQINSIPRGTPPSQPKEAGLKLRQ
ncbi:transporter substrate-binding domain-containing protein [Rhizobium leguminosarum]|uniref:transporter substrate-binding domain-containing protein n=1 Tax=Rhizobium leguminosarum TaxID=384 RepID=UPI001C941056|nr:transporter substrate-binding domain-containing protein [Rhizobium leguminosarum]MBY5816002.1 transporter substrate-binding domain-containing protein [Rhizobium leguminosarum]